MYRKKDRIITAKNDPANYIEGYDIYNSLLLSILNDTTLERVNYEITVHEYRPDLLAQDIYGSSAYMGLLLLQAKKQIDEFKRGTVLRILPKTVLDSIIKEL